MQYNIQHTIGATTQADLQHPIAKELQADIDGVVELFERSMQILAETTAARFDVPVAHVRDWLSNLTVYPMFYAKPRDYGEYTSQDRSIKINLYHVFAAMPGGLEAVNATHDRLHHGGLADMLAAIMAHELEHDFQAELTEELSNNSNIPWSQCPQEYAAEMALISTMLDNGIADPVILSLVEEGRSPEEAKSMLKQVKDIKKQEGGLPLMRSWRVVCTVRRI